MKLLDRIAPRWSARRSVSALAAETWVAEPKHVEAFFASIREKAATTEMRGFWGMSGMPEHKPYETENGVATIPIHGMILRNGDWFLDLFGVDYAATTRIQAALIAADKDPDVTEIAFDVDSPGGTISGLDSLSVTLGSVHKPVRAHVGGQCCSAAYWAIARSDEIIAEPGADVGSIGVYCVVTDFSGYDEKLGIKTRVFRSGEHKGVGEDAITDAQAEKLQARVDEAARRFRAAIEAGRKLSAEAVGALATGEVWFAEDALNLGLIDRIQPITSEANASSNNDKPSEPEPPAIEVPEHPEEMDEHMAANDDAALRAEVEQLRREKAEAEARAKAAEQKAEKEAERAAMTAANAKAKIVADGIAQGRITPVNKARVEKFAAREDVTADELREHVADLAVQTHETPVGSTPTNKEHGHVAHASDAKLYRIFGVSPEEAAKYDDNTPVSVASLIPLNRRNEKAS